MNTSYDIDFANATRRAATGIRPKSGVDVTVEGAPLRTILCSNRALDPCGLELLALAVTGRLRKVKLPPKGETMFAHAVRRASAAWRSGKGGSPSATGDALAVMLRSGQPALGAGERELVAELFAPLSPNAANALDGRPWKGGGHADVVAVVKMLRGELAKEGTVHKNAIIDTARHFHVSKRTVEQYEAKIRQREAATKHALAETKR